RSQKTFTDAPVDNDDIRALLDAAVLAPNHKMTQPWGFAVLGRLARKEYGRIKAEIRVSKDLDPKAAAQKRVRIEEEIEAVPAVIVVTQKLEGDAHRKREDYAAVFMAIENMLLVATSMGLGSKVHTGDVMNAPAMRALVGAEENEQIVAIIHVGEPAEAMKAKPRTPASEKTRWLP
ncbi:MAG TPA: nitroreductase, partial [Longimicrobiales bacterium]